jgi:hypothetical protein
MYPPIKIDEHSMSTAYNLIWGCGSVKTGGADVEAVFAPYVDIISSTTEILMKLHLVLYM